VVFLLIGIPLAGFGFLSLMVRVATGGILAIPAMACEGFFAFPRPSGHRAGIARINEAWESVDAPSQELFLRRRSDDIVDIYSIIEVVP
jgi:hypothetical protein